MAIFGSTTSCAWCSFHFLNDLLWLVICWVFFLVWGFFFFACGLFSSLWITSARSSIVHLPDVQRCSLLFSFALISCIKSSLPAVVLQCSHHSGFCRPPVVFSRIQNSSLFSYFLNGNCWVHLITVLLLFEPFQFYLFPFLRWEQRCGVHEAGCYLLYCSVILS